MPDAEARQAWLNERDALRAEVWPGDGHWTREPVEVEGVYVIGVVPDLAEDPPTPGVKRMRAGDTLEWWLRRWSIPLPTLPPVPEESR